MTSPIFTNDFRLSETPTRATPPTGSVIYAAFGLPPGGDALDSLIPPRARLRHHRSAGTGADLRFMRLRSQRSQGMPFDSLIPPRARLRHHRSAGTGADLRFMRLRSQRAQGMP